MENNFFNVKNTLIEEDLKLFEQTYNILIPQSIKNHYLKYNGGYPERNVFVSEEDKREYTVNYFYSIESGDGMAIEKILPLLDNMIFPDWLVPLADDIGGDIFAYSIRKGEEGVIYYYSHEFEYGENPEEYVTRLSDDIETFLDSLIAEEE